MAYSLATGKKIQRPVAEIERGEERRRLPRAVAGDAIAAVAERLTTDESA